MINTSELRGYMAKKGISQRQLAPKINITETTFYAKMKKGVFGSDEVEGIISELDMSAEEAAWIFFNLKVTH